MYVNSGRCIFIKSNYCKQKNHDNHGKDAINSKIKRLILIGLIQLKYFAGLSEVAIEKKTCENFEAKKFRWEAVSQGFKRN